MKEEIIKSMDNPAQLEKLYRQNRTTFRREFNLVYPGLKENPLARFWHERINYENEEISWGTSTELIFVIIAAVIAGLIAKIPDIAVINPEYFYPRNIGLIVFPLLTFWFAWKQNIPVSRIITAAVAFIVSAIYINLLPGDIEKNDTLLLSCIHLPLFLWTITGFVFTGNQPTNLQIRTAFLRYNGELVVMSAILFIAGVLFTMLTAGLFTLIDIRIDEIYFKNVAIWGLPAIPIFGTYLVQKNPQLVNKVSPVIAKVFTPLVLITLIIYLIAVIVTGKDPYNDREFLLIFNLLLIGVMAIILFSIIETSKSSNNKIGLVMLLGLSILTIIVNGIALSAILFRISEWGITPNRLAVLGSNLLILTNLLIVAYRLFKSTKDSNEIENVERSITSYLPVYGIWAIIVTFLFPVLFGFN
jgi:hypothetical protein